MSNPRREHPGPGIQVLSSLQSLGGGPDTIRVPMALLGLLSEVRLRQHRVAQEGSRHSPSSPSWTWTLDLQRT